MIAFDQTDLAWLFMGVGVMGLIMLGMLLAQYRSLAAEKCSGDCVLGNFCPEHGDRVTADLYEEWAERGERINALAMHLGASESLRDEVEIALVKFAGFHEPGCRSMWPADRSQGLCDCAQRIVREIQKRRVSIADNDDISFEEAYPEDVKHGGWGYDEGGEG